MERDDKKLVEYDPFVMRQFRQDFAGTNLSKVVPAKLLDTINNMYGVTVGKKPGPDRDRPHLMKSDWDFCKYLIFPNVEKDIKTQVLQLDLPIYPYIRTAYSSRTPDELPVLSRWAELPPGFSLPTANYVVCVLYSREQLALEYEKKQYTGEGDKPKFYMSEAADYGIVAIMGTVNPEADPMIPVTMMRNALGMEEGGNSAKLNRDLYMKSAKFWDEHVMVK